MESAIKYTKKQNYCSMINQHSWMFLVTFEKLRKYINDNINTVNMLHLGTRAFDEIGGEVVQTTTFVFRNQRNTEYFASYIDLTKGESEKEKEKIFLQKEKIYKVKSSNYDNLPFNVIGYWLNDNIISTFKNSKKIQNVADAKKGLDTADNERFLRLWQEVNINSIGIGINDSIKFTKNKYIWIPLNKGGTFRRWYGNRNYVLNWYNNGVELKNSPRATIRNEQYYFKSGVTWSDISTGKFAARYTEEGFIFEATGHMLFAKKELLKYILGYMNTKIFQQYADITCTGLHYSNGSIAEIPINSKWEQYKGIDAIVDNCIILSKNDWDLFESSWDFRVHPLLKLKDKDEQCKIASIFSIWQTECEEAFKQLKNNEEELNRIFIDIYGLQDEVTSEVEDKDITIRKADRERDIRSFISYAVGCMFGRYSIDTEGLIYAGGEFADKWKGLNDKCQVRKIEKDEECNIISDSWVDTTFVPDVDNIIPITEDEYFEDDIVSRFIEFVKVVYGEETLEENLDFIAESLGVKANETSRQTIRRYFLKEFYKDH